MQLYYYTIRFISFVDVIKTFMIISYATKSLISGGKLLITCTYIKYPKGNN